MPTFQNGAGFFNVSRSKEIIDASNALLNKSNAPGDPVKISLESKILQVLVFADLLKLHKVPESVLMRYLGVVNSIFPEMTSSPKTFQLVFSAYKSDMNDLFGHG